MNKIKYVVKIVVEKGVSIDSIMHFSNVFNFLLKIPQVCRNYPSLKNYVLSIAGVRKSESDFHEILIQW